jgi:hypothetical protein
VNSALFDAKAANLSISQFQGNWQPNITLKLNPWFEEAEDNFR